ncbi:AMSH-like ubiquitin thioesterase 1 [Coffea arabica]|uniref:AMSH-like ubiquitin thioesterase 1 n=1 Tax=Coffea arabica TaxID=13443 RepID=A0A6P6X654_COFAR|nr:AMSH-like ubiquitin thioesterase 1 isoform X1 [Coffea arabica]
MLTRSSSSSSTAAVRINIASSARKLDVNNRIALGFYYRIADNVLKQANIFREEDNIIDLYIMLLRYSSLVSETIPCHRDYRAALQSDKIYLKKKLMNALAELEKLKPVVQRKLEDINQQQRGYQPQLNLSLVNHPGKQQNLNSYAMTKTSPYVARQCNHQAPSTQQWSLTKPVDEQFRQIRLSIPRPKEETLSRHSVFGPNGLNGQWQPPPSDTGVRYPSNIDFSPVEIPRTFADISRESNGQKPVHDGTSIKKHDNNLESEVSKLKPLDLESKDDKKDQVEEPDSLISFETMESPVQTKIIRQPSPPPVLAEIQDLIPSTSPAVVDRDCGLTSNADGVICAEAPLELHISTALMDSFMRLAKSNTDKNLETCGVLAGSLKNRRFSVTALIIPKQESTSDSCQTTNEEEIFEVQDKQSLFPLGWIHTHPTQSCFMSSIDVHTQYSYQIMLPEAIAIVMAPKDGLRTHGIFRLTTPGGMNVIRQCPRRGFHAHDPPSDGSPIYKQCTDVYMNPKQKFDVIDLR